MDPRLLAGFEANEAWARSVVEQYHTLSDTPFYCLRETFERFYPDTLILYTTRPRADWVRSMLAHGRAGGAFFARLHGLRGIPYTSADIPLLERAYDEHHATVCRSLPVIDLADCDDRAKWELISQALPAPEVCRERSRNLRWPHANRSSC